jgi:hypothetical protein
MQKQQGTLNSNRCFQVSSLKLANLLQKDSYTPNDFAAHLKVT